MYFKLFKMITGEFIIAKVFKENTKTFVLENPLAITIDYDSEMKPRFNYLPWQIISESSQIEVSAANIVYSAAPKSEILTVYMNICTQFEMAKKSPQNNINTIENALNNEAVTM